MKIHSDTLTTADLRAAVPWGVHIEILIKGSRSRAHAFDVNLYVLEKDDLHRHRKNSGKYGAQTDSDDYAATWDEWGIWIAALYDLDPEVTIPYYNGPDDFLDKTAHYRSVVRAFRKPTSIAYRTHTAPWLNS